MKKRLYERAWVKQTFDRYGKIEELQPVRFDLAGEPPDWVWKVRATFFGIGYPGLNRKPLRKWTARDLGYYCGRQSALDSVIWNEVPLSQTVLLEAERCIASMAKMNELNPNPKWPEVGRQMTAGMKKWRIIFKRFINEVAIEARSRPYPEASAFAEGFGKGNVIKPNDLASEGKIGVGERIAWVMNMFWPAISKFESVAELHKLLSAAAKPMGIEITLKRIEKLCQRIGLKFKGRGRPKKSKIQTNLPAAL